MVGSVCILCEQVANWLQHIAVPFELLAIIFVFWDRRIYLSDTERPFRASLAGMTLPKVNRIKGFYFAVFFAISAFAMELYQLATLRFGCA